MSLDVSLYYKIPQATKGTGVFVRENGSKRELTVAEVRDKFPDAVIEDEEDELKYVFDANITHNLGKMADKAGIYQACWHPEEIGATCAADIIPLLEKGVEDMKARPEYFKQFDASNGWGLYIHFLPWVENYLNACREYPDAFIYVNR
jgi:hypothetical protein